MAGWRPALRLARRDAWRHKGRSILVLVMIALPVLAVSAADVVYLTADVDSVESLDRRLGSADALVTAQDGITQVTQDFDPDEASSWGSGDGTGETTTLPAVRAVLGRDVPAIELLESQTRVDTERGLVTVGAVELEVSSQLADGLYRLASGRWPTGEDEVTVNGVLAAKGFTEGEPITIHGGRTLTVVGVAESTASRNYPRILGLPGALGLEPEGVHQWLIGGGAVSWAEVRAINGIGALVLSRSVVENPPPDSERPAEIREWSSGIDEAVIAVVVLIVVMALLEVVLLAGPAFAVGTRRQSRTLALMAASGGTPKQARRVILAGGLVLGGTAAVLGVVLGVVVGWALLPVVQHFSDSWLGPFDVNPLHLLMVAAFGLLSALLAAVVPAWIASRQDVVAVLAGRRGDRKPGLRSPLLGLVLLGVGVIGAVAGASQTGDGSVLIAASAVISVLGMILLIPVVVVALARLARRLPLVARYAVRDAARHRTRTVPAVAAVAATVAGVVALAIANTSDAAESRETYQPQLAMGMGSVSSFTDDGKPIDFSRHRAAIKREAPSLRVSEIVSYDHSAGPYSFVDVTLRLPEQPGRQSFQETYGGSFGSLLAGADALALASPVHADELDDAERILDRGGMVVFTDHPVEGDRIRVGGTLYTEDSSDEGTKLDPVELPAYFLQIRGFGPGVGVVAPGALDPMGLTAATAGLLIDARELSPDEEADLQEVLLGVDPNAYLYVERGYQQENEIVILLGILFALGAVLMLGGTLTATFLALSDAWPDLATLSAVGAAPRTRRGVAAAYALVVGFVGALLGAAVGFIPGIAVTYPLTSTEWMPSIDAEGNALPSHFIDIPWLMIAGLVVVLPLLTALIVGLTARSRLPLVARLD